MNTPSPNLPTVAIKMLEFYTEWHIVLSRHIAKTLRYSLGIRIDNIFSEILEHVSLAQFSTIEYKTAHLSRSIVKNDTLKFMLYALHKLNGIDEKKFLSLSLKAEEIGKMLYGWKRQTEKRKTPEK